VDPCIQKAALCTTNKLRAGVSPTTPGYGATKDEYEKVLAETDAYFDWSDADTEYDATKVVTVTASGVSSQSESDEMAPFI